MRKMKKTIIIIAIMMLSAQAFCQDIDNILRQIEDNNTTLAALSGRKEAARAENRTSLAPPDPEAEFGYMWGAPGGKKNVNVRQSFDFPSLYSSKKALSEQKNNSEEYNYRAQRMEILLTAKKTCLELVACNAMLNLYSRQMANARTIAEANMKMLDKGQTNILEYNKAQMNLAGMESRMKSLDAEKKRLLAVLEGMNGGKHVILEDSVFSTPVIPYDFESWYESVKDENPALAYLKSKAEEADKAVKVVRRSTLPKFSVGFAGEYLRTEKFSGVSVGMSIPLWENSGRVRQAKAEAATAKMEVEDARMQYYSSLKSLHAKAVALQDVVEGYRKLFASSRGDELLYKAYMGGELSLLNYLLEMEYYFSAYEKCLESQRELADAVAELEAFRL